MRIRVLLFVVGLFSLCLANRQAKAAPPDKEWTIMIYMNGDNNLESAALADFDEIAKVGSTEKVDIVVQFDRAGASPTDGSQETDWTQTLRFHVTQGMKPLWSLKDEDIGEANMGDPGVLKDFVDTSKRKYPAKRYALILWDHGDGWRLLLRQALMANSQWDATHSKKSAPSRKSAHSWFYLSPQVAMSPFRGISTDVTNNNDKLYNREIEDALQGEKLNLIGFDACLMGMVETAYAMRGVAEVMVGSEELEPGTGWRYDHWLAQLTAAPTVDEKELGRILVKSYENCYGQYGPTTLSAIDLSQMDSLAGAITRFADKLKDGLNMTGLNSELYMIQTARETCLPYAPNEIYRGSALYQYIDLGYFCECVIAGSNSDRALKAAAQATRAALDAAILENYAGSARHGRYGSNGLAIYFPQTGTIYRNDPNAEHGYEKSNTLYPVEFVQKQRWADFLYVYFQKVPN